MSLVHLAKINNIFFQLSAEVMKSLDILKNQTNVFYTTCLNIFLVRLSWKHNTFFNCTKKLKSVTIEHNQTLIDLSENIKQFSTLQKHLSLSPMDTIKHMHFTLYVYICSVHLSEKITQFSNLKTYLSMSRWKICTLCCMFTYL